MPGELSEEPFWARPSPWPARLLGWGAVAALVLILHWHAFESEDVSWLLVAAGRLLDGGRWGTDILETNTPGAVLLYLPPAWAARALPLAPLQACALWITAILIGCSLVAGRVFALICNRPPTAPQATMAGLVIFSVLAFGSGNFGTQRLGIGNNFGQRDVIIAALLLPMLWLTLWPEFKPETRRALHRLAVGMAGLAFCIKPQFLLPFALWLMVAAIRHGWRDAFRRAGFGWLALGGVLYVAAVLLVFPEWLATARLAAQTYGAYRASWLTMAAISVPAVLLLAATGWLTASGGVARPLVRASAIGAASYLLLSWIEQKSWFYHQLPALLTLLVALGLAIVARLPQITAGRHSAVAAGMLASVLPGLLLATTWQNQAALHDAYEQHPFIRTLRRMLAPGDPWAVISPNSLPGFPENLIEGYRWVLRGPSLWPLPGAAMLAHTGDPDTGLAIEAKVAEDLAADIAKGHPKLIVIAAKRSALLPQDDVIALLSRTPRFASVWSGYRLADHVEEFDLYVPRDAP